MVILVTALALEGWSMATTGTARGQESRSPESWPEADRVRELLRRFNPKQRTRIDALPLDREHCEVRLRSIDPYAHCEPPETAGKQSVPREEAAGIGAELFRKQEDWWLMAFAGGPLYRAGVTGRARLLSVDGQRVSGLDRQQVGRLLRGAEQTPVCLELEWQEKSWSHCLKRQVVSPRTVERLWPGLLRIRAFRRLETRSELEWELRMMDPRAALVIDLREATGGDLHEALDCAALFLPPKTPLAILGYRDGSPRLVEAPADLPTYEGPLKIVVGPETASAAEIFAGILQFQRRAELLGKRTFGKCSSQAVFELADGTRLKLTNIDIRFPDGSSCENQGLHPDRPLLTSSPP